jgi:hypothetical protein
MMMVIKVMAWKIAKVTLAEGVVIWVEKRREEIVRMMTHLI